MKNQDKIVELIIESLKKQDLLTEEIREIKQLVKETRRVADAAGSKAEAAWELVVMTRNEINRPWWKKLFGQAE